MQPLLYISIFIIAIVITGVIAFAGLALWMWNRFLKEQLKSHQEWQAQMLQDFHEAQREQIYYNVAGDGETVDLLIQDPNNQQQYSFGQSYPNPYLQNPGLAFAQTGIQHPEMQLGDGQNMPPNYAFTGNMDKEIRIFSAIADRIRQYGLMPSQQSPDLN